MGASAFFCCFNNRSNNCVSFTSTAANIISLGLLIWGLIDIEFAIKKGSKALYIISFVLICILLLLNLIVFILLNIRSPQSQRTIGNIGKMICLVIIALCVLALIFHIIAFILILVKYVDVEKDWPVKFWPTSDWFAIFVPTVLTIIALIIIAKAANYLYKKFIDKINFANIGQNSMTTSPNVVQPGLFPNNNIAPNPSYEVTVQQSGVNIQK